jgi:ParB family chromosome partitioning protein
MNEDKIEYLSLDRIEAAPQVRTEFPEESLQGLAETMLRVGQLQPIRVRREGDIFVVVAGERRLRAAKMSGRFATIAAIIEEGQLDTAAVLQRQLIENCQQEGLKPLEKARAIRELMERSGSSASETAAMLGLSAATVCKLLALVELPESIQAQITEGKVSASAAYELSRVSDADQQAALVEQIASGQLTRDGVAGIAKRRAANQSNGTPDHPSRARVELSGGRSITVAGVGLDNLETLIAWLEELLGKARKLRPKGLELATFVRILKDEAKA